MEMCYKAETEALVKFKEAIALHDSDKLIRLFKGNGLTKMQSLLKTFGEVLHLDMYCEVNLEPQYSNVFGKPYSYAFGQHKYIAEFRIAGTGRVLSMSSVSHFNTFGLTAIQFRNFLDIYSHGYEIHKVLPFIYREKDPIVYIMAYGLYALLNVVFINGTEYFKCPDISSIEELVLWKEMNCGIWSSTSCG